MVFGLVAAAAAALLYFVGDDIASTASAGESIIDQKISKISESIRIIRTYVHDQGGTTSWGAEIVNTGLGDMRITGIHYILDGSIQSESGCATMTIAGSGGSLPCTISTGVVADMRFTPALDPRPPEPPGIIITTAGGNAFRVFGVE